MADEPVPGFDPGEKPSFEDVVSRFTSPGTDFEEFKKALHSQGAPGRVSPELVAMLNKAAAAGAIPPGALESTGERCIRCEHPHGGPPGLKCLEAEAHLGRSPERRRPDVQLDQISAPRRWNDTYEREQRKAEAERTAAEPDFPPGMPSVGAVTAHMQYVDFRRAGFTENAALKLIANLITSSQPDSNPDET